MRPCLHWLDNTDAQCYLSEWFANNINKFQGNTQVHHAAVSFVIFGFSAPKITNKRASTHKTMQTFTFPVAHRLNKHRRSSLLLFPFVIPYFWQMRVAVCQMQQCPQTYNRSSGPACWHKNFRRTVRCNLCLPDITKVHCSCFIPMMSLWVPLKLSSAPRLSCLTVILFPAQPHSLLPPSPHVLQTTADLPFLHPASLISIHDDGPHLSQWNVVAFCDVAAVPR